MILDVQTSLAHYGVRGMRWGHRKRRWHRVKQSDVQKQFAFSNATSQAQQQYTIDRLYLGENAARQILNNKQGILAAQTAGLNSTQTGKRSAKQMLNVNSGYNPQTNLHSVSLGGTGSVRLRRSSG